MIKANCFTSRMAGTCDATAPLKTLEELLQWDPSCVPPVLCGEPLVSWTPKDQDAPQTLVCHDMKGGYLDNDRFATGCTVEATTPFYMAHWWYMDIFVYFSHHLVTIPPVGWINAAHKHGVLVLGTFITEWDDGAKICSELLGDPDKMRVSIAQLVRIAEVYNFDGWLINIENVVEYDQLSTLQSFLTELTRKMRSALGERSRVIWYDSVIATSGRLKWQDELNALNRYFRPLIDAWSWLRSLRWIVRSHFFPSQLLPWFDCCDAIFLNYNWTEASLRQTAKEAAQKKCSVFVGVDCFGRGTFGGGGWNCCEAFAVVRKFGLSVALFAPGWVCETLPSDNILSENILKFWDGLSQYVSCRSLTSLPFSSNFSVGFTAKPECQSLLFNLSDQQIQPHFLSVDERRIAHRFADDGSSAGIRIISDGKAVRLFNTSILIERDLKIVVETLEQVDFQLVLWFGDIDSTEMVVIRGLDILPLMRSFEVSAKDLPKPTLMVGIGFVSPGSVNVKNLTASYCC